MCDVSESARFARDAASISSVLRTGITVVASETTAAVLLPWSPPPLVQTAEQTPCSLA